MVPQTLGTLLSFLALVAPGIVFELLRERRRAGRKESAFREAARVALGSLVFTTASCLLVLGLLAVLRLLFGIDPLDVARLATDGGAHAKSRFWPIVGTAFAVLLVACTLAVLLDHLLARRRREVVAVRQQTAWHLVFRTDRPDQSVPWVHVHLVDGTSFFGFLRSHTASGIPEEREIVLEGADLTYIGTPLRGGDTPEHKLIGDRWSRIVIPANQIKYLRIQYRSLATDERVPARERPRVLEAQP
ncbi:hypothetical protein FHS29_003968 [Saccharothrix tamanrassetensis]|uniref:Uncharacterized protein n=1 Tax=Saccharothrix tamanrassetensis TaxID=1051531 RepID=A0A841CK89_9PSEU|nr:DUF6338 family protein [Saccharothrix tamanrassetensis]MBB5957373.1 hypothetical protein [Saccharothrix tamanrassetensis]